MHRIHTLRYRNRTSASLEKPFAIVYVLSTKDLVSNNKFLPYAVVEAAIGTHGNCPTVAPVKPYTLLADIFRANCLPFCTAFSIGSVARAMSFFALFLAANNSSRIWGRIPFLVVDLMK